MSLIVQAFVIADNVFRDDRGKMHIQGVFEAIYAAKFPASHPQMAAYFRVRFDEAGGEHSMRLQIRRPNGNVENTPDIRITPNMLQQNAEGFVGLRGFPFQTEGQHDFILVIDDEQVATYPLLLSVIQPGGPNVPVH